MSLTRLAAAFLVLVATAGQAASPRLQDAIIQGQGGTISITRLPIKTATGTVFRDVTIHLQVDEAGNVSLATPVARPGSKPSDNFRAAIESQPIIQAPSPPPVEQHFRPGTYRGADGSLVNIASSGTDLVGGAPIWTLSSLTGSGIITSATWYAGPIASNPKSSRIRHAGIVSQAYSYGSIDSGNATGFEGGALIGAAQASNFLTIVTFRRGCCSDSVTPVARVSYSFVGG